MKITIVQEKKIAFVESKIDRGVLPEDVRPLCDLAKTGHYDAYQLCKSYEARSIGGSRIAEDWLIREMANLPFQLPLIARPSQQVIDDAIVLDRSEVGLLDDIDEEPIPEDRQFRMLKERVRGIQRPQDSTPKRHREKLLEGLDFAAGNARRRASRMIDRGLTKAMAQEIVGSLRERRHAPLPIPPGPKSDAFEVVIQKALSAQREVMQKWEEWEKGWRLSLTNVFAVILAEGEIGDRLFPSAVEERKAEIAIREAWYHDLKSLGMSSSDVADAIGRMYRDDKRAERERAKAEYVRFDKSVHGEFEYNDHSVRRLYEDLLDLHQGSLEADGTDLLALLTPHVLPMTYDEIVNKALRRKDAPLSREERFAAQNMLKWHLFDERSFAGWLAKIVGQNNNSDYPDVGTFLNRKLGFQWRMMMNKERRAPEPLMTKMDRMAAAGANMEPVIEAFKEKFPDAFLAKEAGAIIAKSRAARERQTSLDFGEAVGRSAATYFDLGQPQLTLPGIPGRMLGSIIQPTLPGFPAMLPTTSLVKL